MWGYTDGVYGQIQPQNPKDPRNHVLQGLLRTRTEYLPRWMNYLLPHRTWWWRPVGVSFVKVCHVPVLLSRVTRLTVRHREQEQLYWGGPVTSDNGDGGEVLGTLTGSLSWEVPTCSHFSYFISLDATGPLLVSRDLCGSVYIKYMLSPDPGFWSGSPRSWTPVLSDRLYGLYGRYINSPFHLKSRISIPMA